MVNVVVAAADTTAVVVVEVDTGLEKPSTWVGPPEEVERSSVGVAVAGTSSQGPETLQRT
jgi:hypothetical protein